MNRTAMVGIALAFGTATVCCIVQPVRATPAQTAWIWSSHRLARAVNRPAVLRILALPTLICATPSPAMPGVLWQF